MARILGQLGNTQIRALISDNYWRRIHALADEKASPSSTHPSLFVDLGPSGESVNGEDVKGV